MAVLVVVVVLGHSAVMLAEMARFRMQHPDVGSDTAALERHFRAWVETPTGLLTLAIPSTVATLAVAGLAGLLSKIPLRERLRLGQAKLTSRGFAAAVVGGLALGHIAAAVIQLAGLEQHGALAHMNKALAHVSGGHLVAAIAVLGLLAGVAEEVFFRGYCQSRLSQRWGRWPAIAVAAVAFGAIHADWVQSPFAVVFGLWMGWVAERGGSVWPTVVAHVANNTLFTVGVAWWPGTSSTAVNLATLVAGLTVLLGCWSVLVREPEGQ